MKNFHNLSVVVISKQLLIVNNVRHTHIYTYDIKIVYSIEKIIIF